MKNEDQSRIVSQSFLPVKGSEPPTTKKVEIEFQTISAPTRKPGFSFSHSTDDESLIRTVLSEGSGAGPDDGSGEAQDVQVV